MLIGNRSVLHKSPGRFLAGTIASGERSAFSKPGMLAGRFESFDKLSAAIPGGHLSPSAWALPRTAGGMSSRSYGNFAVDVGTLNLAAGINVIGSTSFTFTVPSAALQLVVSATGTATITFSHSATLAGALYGAGAADFSLTVPAAALGAIVDATGTATFALSAAGTPSAIGHLAGDITPYTELSPQSLAAAVWSALAASNNEAGSMGELLNSAGAAADPLLGTVEGTMTLRDVMRVLLAINAGAATGLEGASVIFKSLDGLVDRVDASYSAGTRTINTLDAT